MNAQIDSDPTPPVGEPLGRDLLDAVEEFACRPTILVACDYDGTLAPIVENPADARPLRESVAALRALASLPSTHVAVVSGRALRDLAVMTRLPEEVHLVGSHGSEFDVGFAHGLGSDQHEIRNLVIASLEGIAERYPGALIETKPASVAFHYRSVDPRDHQLAVAEVVKGPGALPGVHVGVGKMVVELAVVDTNKGTALDHLRSQVGAEAIMFVGDDVTDEDGFATLSGPDLGIRVASDDKATLAAWKVADPHATARLLAVLLERRSSWLAGDATPAIERHSLLSDQRTIALVTPDARVSWMCYPRADGPALFAELLGGPRSGSFTIRPVDGAAPISQRYVGDTMVLETKWATMTVTDYLDCSAGRADSPLEPTSLLRVVEGTGTMEIEFKPRLDYGRAFTTLELTDRGLVVTGSQHAVTLDAPGVSWAIEADGSQQSAVGRVELDGSLVVELTMSGSLGLERSSLTETDRRALTIEHWSGWASELSVPDVYPELSRRSGVVLRALTYRPSGAMYAAATTSLPEGLGGVRNWDYRYCWVRDSCLAASALVSMGSLHEACQLLDWVMERVRHVGRATALRPLYAVEGDEFLPEAVIPTMNGYRGSRPVRIGNAADSQVQLDVFGPIVDLIARVDAAGATVSDEWWTLIDEVAAAVRDRWREPDHGIWEERRPQRHHVHAKVMCWMAIDRSIDLWDRHGRTVALEWRALADEIRGDVIENGWNPAVGAYTIAYGDDELDAAVLTIGLSGLLDPSDERFIATVRAIERDLRYGPIVYRYRLDDGLPGEEGGFLLCTAWLIEAYAAVGRLADAETLLTSYAALAGPTGLFAEEYDPVTEDALGNFPQAYSHLGLVNAAFAVSEGRRRAAL